MPLITGLKKPFPEFKWRWATFQPTESLNDPRVFFGVLRVLAENEGQLPSSASVYHGLQKVEAELRPYIGSRLSLARKETRNLLRNSQQYWSGLGVLSSTHPAIILTNLGRSLVAGKITTEDFAATLVKTLELPNRSIENPTIIEKWEQCDLKIFPLSLILSIIVGLAGRKLEEAYLNNDELTHIVIPLSSIATSVDEQVRHVLAFRKNRSFANSYEDFVQGANDRRMSREFLLFLSYYGFLTLDNSNAPNQLQNFSASQADVETIQDLLELHLKAVPQDQIALAISDQTGIGTMQRSRRMASTINRPGQRKFRRDVLSASKGKCLLTGETLHDVLRACHIIPVEQKGTDDVGNGFCLREDLHILFDSGHLRIDPNGTIHLSEHARKSPSYSSLPKVIALPTYVNKKCIAHRFMYYA